MLYSIIFKILLKEAHALFRRAWRYNDGRNATYSHHFLQQFCKSLSRTSTSKRIVSAFVNAKVEWFIPKIHVCGILCYEIIRIQTHSGMVSLHFVKNNSWYVYVGYPGIPIFCHFFRHLWITTSDHQEWRILKIFQRELVLKYGLNFCPISIPVEESFWFSKSFVPKILCSINFSAI